MIFMFLPVWLLPLLKSVLPAVGAIGSSIASVNAQERMNRYNDPRRQLQRLNAAGLPFAAFEAGQADNKVSYQTLRNSASGESLGNFQTNYQQAQQGDLTIENLRHAGRTAAAGADMAESNRDVTIEENKYQLGEGKYNTRTFTDSLRKLELDLKENQKAMGELDLQMKRDLQESGVLGKKAQAELDLMLQNITKGNKYLDTQDDLDAARDMIVNKMKEGGRIYGGICDQYTDRNEPEDESLNTRTRT